MKGCVGKVQRRQKKPKSRAEIRQEVDYYLNLKKGIKQLRLDEERNCSTCANEGKPMDMACWGCKDGDKWRPKK